MIFLILKQLYSRCNIVDDALTQHIIKGINDPVFKLSFLYGCQNRYEFKQKLKICKKLRLYYDKMLN